jgi:hypothetical protein
MNLPRSLAARSAAVMTLVLLVPDGSAPAQALPDHAGFTEVLGSYVRDGLVDYAALQASRDGLDAYLEEMAVTDAAVLGAASRDAQLAFWINAYNACALRLVVDHYPIRKAGFPVSLVRSLQGVPANSIRQISDTWSRQFCEVAGTARSLDEIEHEIIRPMGQPRIHFAVNCASRSCPVLAPQAYTEEGLDEQLDAAVRRFVASERNYRLHREGDPTLWLNKVLDWYKDDFGGSEGVVTLLLRYVSPEDAEYIRERSPRVEFLEYDWTLNDTVVFDPDGGR